MTVDSKGDNQSAIPKKIHNVKEPGTAASCDIPFPAPTGSCEGLAPAFLPRRVSINPDRREKHHKSAAQGRR